MSRLGFDDDDELWGWIIYLIISMKLHVEYVDTE